MPDPKFGSYGNDTPMQNGVEQWRRIPTRDEPKFDREPSWLERQAKSFTSDPNNAFGPPESLGLVMKNPANVSRLAEMIRNLMPEGRTHTPAEYAISYIRSKYPKLAALPERISSTPAGNLLGEDGGVVRGLHGPGGIQVSEGHPKPDMVNTLGHELTHSIQEKKTDPFGGVQYRDAVTGEPSGVWQRKPAYVEADEMYGYENNPYEVQARQGGSTAEKTYREFQRLKYEQMRRK